MADDIPNYNEAAQVFSAKAFQTQGRSLQSFIASLAVAGLIFAIEVFLFVLFRRKWPQI